MTFFRWFKIGALCSVVSGAVVITLMLLVRDFMPDRPSNVKFTHLSQKAGIEFKNKAVNLEGRVVIKGKDIMITAPKGEGSIKAVCAEGVNFETVAAFAGKQVDINGNINTAKVDDVLEHTLVIKSIKEATDDRK